MRDPDIIKLYFDRDERALEATGAKLGAYLSAIARRMLPDLRDVEEVVSDACLALWKSIPPQKPEDLASYAGRLCRNAAIDRARGSSRLKRGSGEYDLALEELSCLSSGQTPESELEAALFNKALDGFLRSLRKRPRRIFVQRYLYLLSVAEIAKDNGMSEAAVKMQLSRTRARLRDHLIKEGVLYE